MKNRRHARGESLSERPKVFNRARRRGAVVLAASVIAACASNEEPPKAQVTPETPKDPAHCSFELPPDPSPTKPANAPSAVLAGFGSAVLQMPIGAPLGGYGDRMEFLGGTPVDARARRFAKSFVPSVGMHDAPRADAVAIEAGGERLVIVRADVPLLNENSVFDLEAAVAPDGSMRGRILLTASHSHAAWAGWQPSLPLMPGIDRPRRDLADRIVGSMASAVKAALDALKPASIGVAVDAAFDPDNTVTSDRRGENDEILGPDGNTAGKDKDPIVWAMRIDRADGSPMAAFVNLAVHGTLGEGSNPLVSTDIPGAIARSLSAELGYPVLHLQGSAGDITPREIQSRKACKGAARCLDMPGMEVVGSRAAALVKPLVEGIKTGETAALEVVTRTFYEGRDYRVKRPDGTELWYAPPDVEPDGVIFDDSGKIANPIDEFTTASGAGLCGDPNAGSFAALPGAAGVYSSCLDLERGAGIIFGLFDVPAPKDMPLCDTLRTTATAVRFSGTPSGDWLIATIPGEPTAPFTAYLRSRSPAGPERTLVIGYAGDHAGYILTAEDWLAGGYEPSINFWGPLEGEVILDGIIEAANMAWTPEIEDPAAGTSRFVDWEYPPADPIVPIVTTDHGSPAPNASVWWPDTDVSEAPVPAMLVPRAVSVARFAWYGGDPAVDMPEVFIEREAAPGVFEPLLDAGGRPASSRDGAVVLTYTPDPLDSASPEHHVFAAVWQPVPPDPFSHSEPARPFSLPLGRYRFRAVGAAVAAGGQVGYEVASDPFEVTAAPLSPASTALRGASSIEIQAELGVAPGLRALQDGPSDTEIPLLGPWSVELTMADSTIKMVMVTPSPSGAASVPLTEVEAQEVVSVMVRDAAGNGGVLQVQ
jgi:neutral ceramidase